MIVNCAHCKGKNTGNRSLGNANPCEISWSPCLAPGLGRTRQPAGSRAARPQAVQPPGQMAERTLSSQPHRSTPLDMGLSIRGTRPAPPAGGRIPSPLARKPTQACGPTPSPGSRCQKEEELWPRGLSTGDHGHRKTEGDNRDVCCKPRDKIKAHKNS